jgi:serine/threonine-protein kinase
VYAIGIVMFEMLTGKLPYVGMDQQSLAMAHLREAVPHVMDFNPLVPVHLDRIVYKVMSKNPSDRYATADQLGRILIGYKEQGTDQTINQPQPGGPAPIKAPTIVAKPPAGQPTVIQPPPSPQSVQPTNTPPGPYQLPYTPAQPAASSGRPVVSGQTPSQPYQPPVQQPYQPPVQQSYQPATQQPQRPYQPPVSPTQQGQPQSYQPPYQQYGTPQPAQPYQQPGYVTSAPAPNYQQPAGSFNQPADPNYRILPAPPLFDAATVALAIIAALMVIFLIPFWLAVLSAYSR